MNSQLHSPKRHFKRVEENNKSNFVEHNRLQKQSNLVRKQVESIEKITSSNLAYPIEAKNVNQEGRVKISIKSSSSSKKKTGALSPRAPEKIRRNRATEMKVYGENACYTLFEKRPEMIVRLWITVEMAKKCGHILAYLAQHKKVYHIVDNQEMEKVSATEHHNGICMLVKKSKYFSLEGYLQIDRKQDCLVLLDNVSNPQNIGGIMRICSFFGVKGMITENPDLLNSGMAAKVAEGGLEFVYALETENKHIALTQLRNSGYQVVHLTSNKQACLLVKAKLKEKIVFVLSEIVSENTEYLEDTMLRLSLENPLKASLNVAVSAGILISQWYKEYAL